MIGNNNYLYGGYRYGRERVSATDASELERMMEQARQRMGEAHARAKPPPQDKGAQPQEQKAEPPKGEEPQHSQQSSEDAGLLGSLFRDKDKTIILALMLLLADEHGDNSLLFALMYLLMD